MLDNSATVTPPPATVTRAESVVPRAMKKYLGRPMDLADGSLVWLAGRSGVRDILTVDSRNFATFRTPQGKPFKDVLAARSPTR